MTAKANIADRPSNGTGDSPGPANDPPVAGFRSRPKGLDFLKTIVRTAEWLDKECFFVRDGIIMSAGGSAYYDLVTESFAQARLIRKASTVLRSGCYFTHEAGEYERLFLGNTRAIERHAEDRGAL